MKRSCEKIIKSVEYTFSGIKVIKVNVQPDHVHLVASIDPQYSVSEIIKLIKSNTGRLMRKKYYWLGKVYWGRGGIWSTGYFVSTVGLDEEIIMKYVQYQGDEDQERSYINF